MSGYKLDQVEYEKGREKKRPEILTLTKAKATLNEAKENKEFVEIQMYAEKNDGTVVPKSYYGWPEELDEENNFVFLRLVDDQTGGAGPSTTVTFADKPVEGLYAHYYPVKVDIPYKKK